MAGKLTRKQADAEHKIKIRSAYILRGHDQLLTDCRDLVTTAEEIAVSHLDTIDTALTLLEAFKEMSPHMEVLKQEMLVKSQVCEDHLIDLLPIQSRLQSAKAGKEYMER